jgi:two-component system, OmpR family, sensor histidine kinase SaeS
LNARDSSARTTLTKGFGVLASLTVLTLALAQVLLHPPTEDLLKLGLFLPVSGGASLLLCAIVPSLFVGGRLRGVRGKLLIAATLSAGLILLNVGFTAYLMFLSSHDLKFLSILMVFSLGISAFFALTVANAFDSTLKTLLDGVRSIGEGKLATRVALHSGDELEDIGGAFNMMAEQLDEAFGHQRALEEARRTLIAAVSHDLRTPLATMRAMVESINDGVVTEEETIHRYLRTVQVEIGYLNQLIDDLFELSQIDSGTLQLRPEPSSVSDLVSDALEALRPEAERRSLRIEGIVAGQLPSVVMDVPRMQRVLYNLVQNALRHTPPDGSVIIRAECAGGEIEISVQDDGEGVGVEELPFIFERFYRGDHARKRAEAGSGLGLTIAKGIVELHGGHIWVRSERGEGTTFTFTVPTSGAIPQLI